MEKVVSGLKSIASQHTKPFEKWDLLNGVIPKLEELLEVSLIMNLKSAKPDFPLGNYQREIMKLIEAGKMTAGYSEVEVAHDDWCKIYKRKPCNCNPEIRDGKTGEKLN